MKRTLLVVALGAAFLLPGALRAEFGLGGGIFYNRQLGDIKDSDDWKFNKNFVSYMVTLKYQVANLLGLEGSVDYYSGSSGTIDYTLRPMGTAVLSIPIPGLDIFNAGVGINSTYTKYKKLAGGSNDDWSKLSYHFKAGIQLPIADLLWINGDCYYFVDDLRDIEDFDSKLLTFGARAMLRF